MKAILFSAGYGTRLGSITREYPKCLLEVRGKPILQHWIEKLHHSGFSEILINSHFQHRKVSEFVKKQKFSSLKIKLDYEPTLLGTAGTLQKHEKWLSESENFLCAHSDNYSDLNINDLLQTHTRRPENCIMTMTTFFTKNPENCGMITKNERGIVQSFVEKPKQFQGNIANGAIYVMNRVILPILSDLPNGETDLSTSVLPKLIGRIQTHEHHGYLIDIGTPENLNYARGLE